MNRRVLAAALVLAVVAGCASGPGEDVDTARAADANAALGVDHMRKGNNEAALEALERALSYDAEHVEANWALAVVYDRLEAYDKADTHYQRAIDASPTPQLLNSYGAFLCERDRVDEAVLRFERAVRNPRYTTPEDALANAGVCLARAGRADEADDFLRQALDKNPEHAPALAELAKLQFAAGEHLGARAFLQRRDAVQALDEELLRLAARNELALGDRVEARNYLRRFNDDRDGPDLTLDELANATND